MPFTHTLSQEERQQILDWATEGVMYAEISRRLNGKVTKQRVKQICAKANIDSKSIRNLKNQLELEAKMTAKWGKEWNNPSMRRSYLYQSMRQKFKSKKANATRLGIEFTIDFGDIEFPTHCPILGIELDYFTEDGWSENSPSFDRLNPSLGYVKGNVIVISMRANRIKNNGTAEEHRKIADFMQQFSSGSS
jgi:hypothetical protein